MYDLKTQLIDCPLCNSNDIEVLLELDCGNFEGSKLYNNIVIQTCKQCGHVYNRLSQQEYKGLIEYYDQEYAPINIGGKELGGDRPGSSSSYTSHRHEQLFDLVKKHTHTQMKVLDIGCAMGGMLLYLKEKNFYNLYGIDVTPSYLEIAAKNEALSIQFGSAESIPFRDHFFDLLIIDQVMEHLIDPKKAFQEAKRSLVKGGLFCIGVPNAQGYSDSYFFDFYWFLMREHIQHFDLKHLEMLANSEGFELLEFNYTQTPMMSQTMVLPNLNALFQYTGKIKQFTSHKNIFHLATDIYRYVNVEFSRLEKKKKLISAIKSSNTPVYVWGIGREFLYLYQNSDLKYCNIQMLLDGNEYKQKNITIDNMNLLDGSMVSEAPEEATLIITAIAHKEAIKKIAQKYCFKGTIVDIDESVRVCPNCKSLTYQPLYSFTLNNFDKYQLLKDITIVSCNKCGFLINNIVTEKQLEQFYISESQYSGKNSFGTGGINGADRKRYQLYEQLLSPYITLESTICDIGCAKGGLVGYLDAQGYKNALGVEINQDLVKAARDIGLNVKEGSAQNIPLKEKSVDLLIFSHVFEHLLEFEDVMSSVYRVLKDDGVLFVEVPNASEYYKYSVFDFFWFGIREHINHFSKESLVNLLSQYQLKDVKILETHIAYPNENFSYPSLIAIFQKEQTKKRINEFSPLASQHIHKYLTQESNKVVEHIQGLKTIFENYDKVYMWGIGQEFFILTSFFNIQEYLSQVVLVDKDEYKQNNHTFLNQNIHPQTVINGTSEQKSIVVVCSIFNYEAICSELNNNMPRVCINEL